MRIVRNFNKLPSSRKIGFGLLCLSVLLFSFGNAGSGFALGLVSGGLGIGLFTNPFSF
jgi:hypothetical protein